jgi:hypothetical protein
MGLFLLLLLIPLGWWIWTIIRLNRLDDDPIQDALTAALVEAGTDLNNVPAALMVLSTAAAEHDWTARDVSDRVAHALRRIRTFAPRPVYEGAHHLGKSFVLSYQRP